jgi:hypothetical protein
MYPGKTVDEVKSNQMLEYLKDDEVLDALYFSSSMKSEKMFEEEDFLVQKV